MHQKIFYRLTLTAVLVINSMNSFAEDSVMPNVDSQAVNPAQAEVSPDRKDVIDGWHFYKDPAKEKAEKEKQMAEQQAQQQPPNSPKMMEINVQWLRDNLPKLRDTAINDPSDVNIANYWMAMRLGVDMATRFADATKRFNILHPEYSEAKRRPQTELALDSFKQEVEANKAKAMKKISQKAGIWYFFASTCHYCQQETPVIKAFQEQFGVNVLPISMDGLGLPNMEQFEVDAGGKLAQMLGVTQTPTMYLVTNDGKQFHMVSTGLVALDELQDSIFEVAKRNGLLDKADYDAAKDVKPYLVVGDDEGPLKVDEEMMKRDPSYLTAILQSKLAAFPIQSAQPVGDITSTKNENGLSNLWGGMK